MKNKIVLSSVGLFFIIFSPGKYLSSLSRRQVSFINTDCKIACSDRGQIAGYRKVHTFIDKMGKSLGDVYVREIGKDIFNSLRITKENDGKTDTLYKIEEYRLSNPKGIDRIVGKKDFYGYKFIFKKSNFIEIEMCDKHGHAYSDPIHIEWDYQEKKFEIPKEP